MNCLRPAKRRADALDRFLARYRLLVQQVGPVIRNYAKIEVLLCATQKQPKLTTMWAAWRQAGGNNHNTLLQRQGDAVAESAGGAIMRAAGYAWDVQGKQSPRDMILHLCGQGPRRCNPESR